MVRKVRGVAARGAQRIIRATPDVGLSAGRQAKRDARRAELVAAAITVIRRDGPGASMDRMAAEAGVTKPILYRNFTDRAGLVAAIAEFGFLQVTEGLEEALHADVTPRELIATTIDTYLAFIESEPEVYRFLVRGPGRDSGNVEENINEFIDRTSRQVAIVLGEGLRAAGQDSGPADAWAYGIVGMVQAAGDWWLDRGTLPRSRLCGYLTSLLCDGLPAVETLGTAGTWLADGTDTGTDTYDEPATRAAEAPGTVTPLTPTRRRSS